MLSGSRIWISGLCLILAACEISVETPQRGGTSCDEGKIHSTDGTEWIYPKYRFTDRQTGQESPQHINIYFVQVEGHNDEINSYFSDLGIPFDAVAAIKDKIASIFQFDFYQANGSGENYPVIRKFDINIPEPRSNSTKALLDKSGQIWDWNNDPQSTLNY